MRAVTFLAPNMQPIYQFIVSYINQKLNLMMELVTGASYDELFDADFAFVCGLPYVLYTAPRMESAPITALAAPVLIGERYQNRPIYFSDVIVRADSAFQNFADLRGTSWAFNEPLSQSGYGITRYTLQQRGYTNGYFGRVIEAGFHQTAIQWVCDGKIDAAAIDSQVLAVEIAHQPALSAQLHIIDTFGPSTIQPFVAATRLSPQLKNDVRAILLEMHHDPEVKKLFQQGFIDHFVAVEDSAYDDIRSMLAACEAAKFLAFH